MTAFIEEKTAKSVGKRLKIARTMAKLRQEDVGRHIWGEPIKNRISEIENGRLPNSAILLRLCLFYGVSADWVLGFTGEPDIDPKLSQVAILYNAIAERSVEMVNNYIERLSEASIAHLTHFNDNSILDLINFNKKLIQHCVDHSVVNPIIKEMMHRVQLCEKYIAQQNVKNYQYLDSLIERDPEMTNEKLFVDDLMEEVTKPKKSNLGRLENLTDFFNELGVDADA